MTTLKNYRTVESGHIWNSYFNAAQSGNLDFEVIEKKAPFGLRGGSEETMPTFKSGGKTYAVRGYDHFNAHFSGFTDETAIYGLHIAEVV